MKKQSLPESGCHRAVAFRTILMFLGVLGFSLWAGSFLPARAAAEEVFYFEQAEDSRNPDELKIQSYYDYVQDILIPEYGLADLKDGGSMNDPGGLLGTLLDVTMQAGSSGSMNASPLTTGLLSADVIDMNQDGTDDCIVSAVVGNGSGGLEMRAFVLTWNPEQGVFMAADQHLADVRKDFGTYLGGGVEMRDGRLCYYIETHLSEYLTYGSDTAGIFFDSYELTEDNDFRIRLSIVPEVTGNGYSMTVYHREEDGSLSQEVTEGTSEEALFETLGALWTLPSMQNALGSLSGSLTGGMDDLAMLGLLGLSPEDLGLSEEDLGLGDGGSEEEYTGVGPSFVYYTLGLDYLITAEDDTGLRSWSQAAAEDEIDLTDRYEVIAGETFVVSGDYFSAETPSDASIRWGITGSADAAAWEGMSVLNAPGGSGYIISKALSIRNPGIYRIKALGNSSQDITEVVVVPKQVTGLRRSSRTCDPEDSSDNDPEKTHQKIDIDWDTQDGVSGYRIEICDREDFDMRQSGIIRRDVQGEGSYADAEEGVKDSLWYIRVAAYVIDNGKEISGDFSEVLPYRICSHGTRFSLSIEDKVLKLEESGKFVTATLKPLFEADDAMQQALEATDSIRWSFDDPSRVTVLSAPGTAWGDEVKISVRIQGDCPGKFLLKGEIPEDVSAEGTLFIEPEIEVEIGTKLLNGDIFKIPYDAYSSGRRTWHVSEDTDVYCHVTLKKADPDFFLPFFEDLQVTWDGLESALVPAKGELEILEDGLSADWKIHIGLDPGLKEEDRAVRGTLVLTTEAGTENQQGIEASRGLHPRLKFRSDGSRAKQNGGSLEHVFYYKDAFFYRSAMGYWNDLAVMSLGLEISGFSDFAVEDRYTDTLFGNERAANLKNAYNQLGFRYARYYSYNERLSESYDKAAFSIAEKVITNGDRSDTLIAVVIRGGGYGAEWASNFNVGETGNHVGFDRPARIILEELNRYILEVRDKERYTGDLKLWIVGFSRGAAVANLLGHYINQGKMEVVPFIFNTYVYGFATPQGAFTDTDAADDNIQNVVSANDLVPKVALEKWGFTRYGTTNILPEYAVDAVDQSFLTYTGEELNVAHLYRLENNISTWLGRELTTREAFVKKAQSHIVDTMESSYSGGEVDFFPVLMDGLALAWNLDAKNLLKRILVTEEVYFIGDVLSWNPERTTNPLDIAAGIKHAHYPEHYLAWLETGGLSAAGDDTYAWMSEEEKRQVEAGVEMRFNDGASSRWVDYFSRVAGVLGSPDQNVPGVSGGGGR